MTERDTGIALPLHAESGRPVLFGAHVSAAGGVHLALERGREIGCSAIQIFTRNPRQRRSPEIKAEAVEAFSAGVASEGPACVISHGSYLINLATPEQETRERSISAMIDEVRRAAQLRIPCVVTHLGGHMGDGEANGLKRLTESLDEVLKQTDECDVAVALETTAGAGTMLGGRFEHLAYVLEHSAAPERLTTCFDTCHVFVAGHDIRAREAYDETWDAFARTVGMPNLAAIHVNDTKKPFGSHSDRHDHIGDGELGFEPFRWIMNDSRLETVPKIAETPKMEEMGRENVARLRRLVGSE